MLRKNFIRDGNRRIIGSVTTGYSDTSKAVRDDHNRIAGRTSDPPRRASGLPDRRIRGDRSDLDRQPRVVAGVD